MWHNHVLPLRQYEVYRQELFDFFQCGKKEVFIWRQRQLFKAFISPSLIYNFVGDISWEKFHFLKLPTKRSWKVGMVLIFLSRKCLFWHFSFSCRMRRTREFASYPLSFTVPNNNWRNVRSSSTLSWMMWKITLIILPEASNILLRMLKKQRMRIQANYSNL